MPGRTQTCTCEGIIRDLAIRPNGPGRLTRMAGICHLPRKRPMRLILTTPGSVSANPSSCVATRASGSLSKCRRLLADSADVVAERVAPCPGCSVTLTVSEPSTVVSLRGVTVMKAVFSLAGNVTVPLKLMNNPSARKASPPWLMIHGTAAKVSVLLIVVGLPYRPKLAGNGGLKRGWPFLPSSDSSSAVSSPQM